MTFPQQPVASCGSGETQGELVLLMSFTSCHLKKMSFRYVHKMRSFPSPKWNSFFGILPDTRRQLSYHLRFKLKNAVWSYYRSLFYDWRVMMLGWPNEYCKSRSSIWVFDLFQASAAGASIVLYRLYMCHAPLQLIFGGKHFSAGSVVSSCESRLTNRGHCCKLLGPHRWRRHETGEIQNPILLVQALVEAGSS